MTDDNWATAMAAVLHDLAPSDRGPAADHLDEARRSSARADHIGELVWAWQAARGHPPAIAKIDEIIAREAARAAGRFDRSVDFRDEVAQAARIRLLVGEHPRVLDYRGRGPLAAWIGIAVLRTALNLRRGKAPLTADVVTELVSHEPDPELRHLKSLYRAQFREALEHALAALADRQRALLRLHCVEGMSMVALGRLYGVHETTVARWVRAATSEVAEAARQRLYERLALSPSGLESVARMVLSNLDYSIAAVLR